MTSTISSPILTVSSTAQNSTSSIVHNSTDPITAVTVLTSSTTESLDSSGILLYHVDIFLLGLIGLFVLWRLPRSLARFWRSSEWLNGHILLYTKSIRPAPRIMHYNSMRRRPNCPNSLISPESDKDFNYSIDSPTVDDHIPKLQLKGSASNTHYPPHIASCPVLFRPFLSALRTRLSPGFSVGEAFACCIWFAVLVYPTSYKSTGPLLDTSRTGWIGVSQLPFVFAFAAKNNVLAPFLGMGYERVQFLHRFLARLVLLAANLHSLGYIYKWLLSDTFAEDIVEPANLFGLFALIALDCIFLFSLRWVRQRAYRFFLVTHIICYITILPCLYLHKDVIQPYVKACIIVYSIDYVLRLVKTRFTNAIIRPLPELGMTRIECPDINSGWRAGQHVRIRVMSSGMGLFGWSEVHPFTIASSTRTPEGMVLMCKKAGSWTTKLFDMAKQGGYAEAGVGRNVNIMVEGPYGGTGPMMFASYSAAVFVVGGSGIAFALSNIQDLISKDSRGESRLKVIELVWIVQDPAALIPLLPQLSAFISQSIRTPLKISVFYTRAPVGKFPFPENFFHHRLSLAPGRPKIAKLLESTISKTVRLGAGAKDHQRNCGMVVAICGPVGLADDCATQVSSIDEVRRDQVGGVELFEETFGL